MANASRGQWSGRLGFILAAAGSAVGLGNIWRFPYMAGENGGGAFVLLYLACVLLIGLPVLFSELAMGRKTERNAVGAFRALVPNTWWPAVGYLGIAAGFGILAFYSVVAGWTLGYLGHAVLGDFGAAMTAEQSNALFTSLIGSPTQAIAYTAGFLLLTILIVRGGVSSGIERAAKILMPALLAILIVLAVRSVTLPGGMEGLSYLLKPDFSKMTAGSVMAALGQALFSLSLGMGAMVTYGSYFPKRENMPFAGAMVAVADTSIAILAGLIMFPALFSAGLDPAAGPGLVFVVLPTVFNSLPAGTLFAIAFYALLAIAALTSTISLLEVVVAYFVDERGWKREKAAWVLGSVCFLIAVPSALSQGGADVFTSFLFDTSFLDIQNIIWGNYALSIGALATCLFVGWKWTVGKGLESLEASGHVMPLRSAWAFVVRFLSPIAIAIVLGYIVLTGQYF